MTKKNGKPHKSRPDGYWNNRDNLDRELAVLIRSLGRFPRKTDLVRLREFGIMQGLKKHGGIRACALRLGFLHAKRSGGYWEDASNVERELRGWIEKHGRFPTNRALDTSGHAALRGALRKLGLERWRVQLGFTVVRHSPGYWEDASNVERELRGWTEKHGRFPSPEDLDATGHASLRGALGKQGREHWRAKLGFGPLTPEVLREHADVLALVVMTLGLTDTGAFWETIQKRWTVHDLKNAISTFQEGVGRFRALMTVAD